MDLKQIISLISSRLLEDEADLHNNFFSLNSNTPTKHFIVDNLLPKELVEKTYEGFPDESLYHFKDSFREKKYTFAKLDQLESNLPSLVTDALQSKEIIKIIGNITEIDDLEGDPSLYAGGLSRMDETHFLNPHIDNSHDSTRSKYRRLNVLFYVSPNITEGDGGNFELWDPKVKKPLKIPSLFNRLVVMETTKTSWHSVDNIVSDIQRCCLSNYYFSKSSPDGMSYYHVTSFLGRPSQHIRRNIGRIDNFLRQTVAKTLNISRGKHLSRKNTLRNHNE